MQVKFSQCHGSKVLMPFGILQWYIGATSWSTSTNALLLANVQEAEFVACKYSTKSRQDTRQPRKVGVSMNTQISAAKGAVFGLSKATMSPLLQYPFGELCSGTSVHLYLQARQTPSQCFWQEKQVQPKQALAQRPQVQSTCGDHQPRPPWHISQHSKQSAIYALQVVSHAVMLRAHISVVCLFHDIVHTHVLCLQWILCHGVFWCFVILS